MPRFVQGQSGNPGGRPKGLGDIREIARKHTHEAIETLVTVMHNANATDQARVHAATALLDRAWGVPEKSLRRLKIARHLVYNKIKEEVAAADQTRKLINHVKEIIQNENR